MLAFLSVAFLVYGAMHLYALSKVAVFPLIGLGLALVLGVVKTLSPLLINMENQTWHGATIATSWVAARMGFLFLFCSMSWYSTPGCTIDVAGFRGPSMKQWRSGRLA
jgi:hypothetical protein